MSVRFRDVRSVRLGHSGVYIIPVLFEYLRARGVRARVGMRVRVGLLVGNRNPDAGIAKGKVVTRRDVGYLVSTRGPATGF